MMSYWVLVIVGALDISALDFDIDLDIDTDYEADLSATGEHDVSFLNNILKYFNLKDIPLMVFLTFWCFPVLIATVYLNDLLGVTSFLLSLVFLLPIGFVALFFAKFATLPFVKFFRALENESTKSTNLLGRVVKVRLPITETKIGQAEAFINGSNFLLNVKTKSGSLEKGAEAMVIQYVPEQDCYLVEPHFSID